MAKLTVTGAAGLFGTVSEFSAPPNHQNELTNCVVKDAGIIEPRSGFIIQDGYDFTANLGKPGLPAFGQFGSTLYAGNGEDTVVSDAGTAWTSKTIPAAHANAFQVRFLEFMQNLYSPTVAGLYVTESAGGDWARAGFSTPTPPTGSASTTGPLAAGTELQVASGTGAWPWGGVKPTTTNPTAKAAYRVVWGKKDSHNRIILSEPSARSVATNSSGADRYVWGDVPAIPETTASTFYQVYRSQSIDATDSNATPSDNLYQVYEGLGAAAITLTGGATAKAVKANGSSIVTVTYTAHGYRTGMKVYIPYAAGDVGVNKLAIGLFYITVTDANTFAYDDLVVNGGATYTNLTSVVVTPKYYPFFDYSPDNILNTRLYTNPIDGDGWAAGNAEPPACADICTWKGRMWFANTNLRHAYQIQLIGVQDAGSGTPANPAGSPDGLAANDIITIDGMSFVAIGAPSVPTYGAAEYKFTTGGTPSTNIEATAKSLVDAINNYTGNTTIHASYISGENDFPGIIRLERLTRNAASFNISITRTGTLLGPKAWAPFIPNGATSKNDAFVHRLYFSKPQQPESVPALQYIDVGAANKQILRIIPQKELLYIFKEDGIFILSGDYPFRLDLMDSNTILTSPNTAVGGDSSIYGLFNVGVCRITTNGPALISKQIAEEFRHLATTSFFAGNMVGALNETDGIYLLQTMRYTDGAYRRTTWIYNIRTNLWSQYNFRPNSSSTVVGSNYSNLGLAQAFFFFRPAYTSKYRLVMMTVLPIGGSPVHLGVAKETRFDQTDVTNLQYIDGAFSESTRTSSGTTTPGSDGTGTLSVTAAWSNPKVGDIIYHGSLTNMNDDSVIGSGDFFGLITAISSNTQTFTYKQINSRFSGSFASGQTVSLLRGYKSRATYHISNPDQTRHYRDLTLMFSEFSLNSPKAVSATDLSSTDVQSAFSFSDTNNVITRFKRVLIPADQQYANALYVGIQNDEAGTYYKLLGVSLTYENVSERNSR